MPLNVRSPVEPLPHGVFSYSLLCPRLTASILCPATMESELKELPAEAAAATQS
jgi:hypothetical protein